MMWVTEDRRRFFHLDAETTLPAGDLVLVGWGGRRITVAADAAAPYEVTAQEALSARIRRMQEAVDEAGRRVAEMLARPGGDEELAEAVRELSAGALAGLRRRLAMRRPAPSPRWRSETGPEYAVEVRPDGQLALAADAPGRAASAYSLRLDLAGVDQVDPP